ncbi:MAG: YfhO family protein [Saprospiraceae bacterium]|nr:YfhO family protein [Saprospiraceae bacterium]
MQNPLLKKFLPHCISIGLFILIISYFFLPHWQGKVFQQGDVTSWQGSAAEILDHNKKHPDDPALWTGSMFSGMPSYQIATPTHYNLLNYVQTILTLGFLTGPIAIFFLCAISFYIFYLVLGLSVPLAFTGSLATFLITGNFIVWEAGHLPKLVVLAMAGFIMAGIIVSYRGKYLRGGALFALGMGINILNNHVQMSYYLFLLTLPLIISYAYFHFRDGNFKNFLIPSAMMSGLLVLAFLSSASSILPTYEYAKETMRGGHILAERADNNQADVNKAGLQWDYAMNWSNGTQDILACLIPGAAGGGTSEPAGSNSATAKELRKKGYQAPKRFQAPLYWGSLPFTSGPFYFGAIVCFLFVLGLFILKGPLKWWIASAVTFGLLLSMGKNFEILNKLMFDFVPLYSKFRAPSSVLSVVSYFVPVLSMLALYEWNKKELAADRLQKSLYYSAGITGGLCLLLALMGGSLFSFEHPSDPNYVNQGLSLPALIEDRKNLLQSDSFRSFLFILLGASALWLHLKNKLNSKFLAVAIAVLICFDFGTVATRYVHKDDFVSKSKKDATQKPRAVDQQILNDKSYHRVLDLTVNTFNSSIPSFHHKHVGGYHPAKLQRYQDMIDHHLDREIQQLSSQLQTAQSDSAVMQILQGLKVMNMLNTKYFILGQPGKEVSLPNASANGPVWFVEDINYVKTPDEEIESIRNIDPKRTAIVHEEFKDQLKMITADPTATIQCTAYSPNKLTYKSSTSTNQLAVFSEVWYGPDLGWKMYIDGKETDLIRANYILRAAVIPSGSHEIVMEFKPRSFMLGKTLSMLCSLLIILFIGFVLYKEIKMPDTELK